MKEVLNKGLPVNIEAEQFVLGSILLSGGDLYPEVAASVGPVDFALEKHRRIFARMAALYERGEKIEYLTLGDELSRAGHLESVDGVAYLSSLTDGLPRLANIESYLRVVKEKAARRRVIHTASRLIADASSVELEGLLSGAESDLRSIGDDLAERQEFQQPGDVIQGCPGGLDAFLSPRLGLETPWPRVTSYTNGLQPGDLCLLAARPSVGKTAAALQFSHHVAQLGKGVAFFSLEMSRESLVRRLICGVARVDQQRFRASQLDQEERRRVSAATGSVAQMPLFLHDHTSGTVAAVHAAVRRLRARHSVALVVIDYIGLMVGTGRAENRNAEVSAISRSLKLMARELGIPLLVLSQLNRALESRGGDSSPRLSDLRDSGSLEQDADLVVFLHRPEMYRPRDESLRGLADFVIAKQRNGPTGKIDMVFLREVGRFEMRA